MTRTAFWPPKPKLVETAVRTGQTRPLLGTLPRSLTYSAALMPQQDTRA
jgi:hypothetical protein